ncbi:MAG: hypothetical protein M0P10_06480 [Sphaerochaetaceae bacterium]|jgi:integrase|nr:hypothetical protein [Sphaerochaetaceae bacterium]
MAKVRIKNISRHNFDLSLEFVKEGKVVSIKPGMSYLLSQDEYDYIKEQSPVLFSNGYLEVVSGDKNMHSRNVMTDKEIKDFLELPKEQIKTGIEKIDSPLLIRDIFKQALHDGKTHCMEILDKRIKEIDGDTVLI